MESQIWKVQTEKIGSLESFKSERDMESFLMNNPAIVGCWNPESDLALPTLIRQQISTKTARGRRGRIDLVGISIGEKDYELRIFELKVTDIDVSSVEQLDDYLRGWEKEKSAKSDIRGWILSLGLQGIDEKNVNKITDNPVGVLVGPKFQPEAISHAIQLKIKGIRLARFRAEKKSEYFVIVEDQVGKIIEAGKRQTWSWDDLVKKGLIDPSDDFSISYKGTKFLAKADQKYLDYPTKKLILNAGSVKIILDKEAEIRKKVYRYKLEKKWFDNDLESLKKGEGIFISHATAFFYFASGGPFPSCYWFPTRLWIHEKSRKSLEQLKNELTI